MEQPSVPIYGYRCESCGNEFELKQSFSAEPRHECPVCKSIARRRFFAPPVIYKGSGFYTTDYARKSNGKSTANASADKSQADDAGESHSTDSSSSSSSSSSDSASKSSRSSSDSSSTAKSASAKSDSTD
jgi:putative FmdB family regulatory protein